MSARLPRRVDLGLRVLLCLAALWGLFAGWTAFWFQCDDAYIAYRYVSNSRLGYGYTWNPPPFRMVEGYTSFLWVVLLDVVWRVSGSEPPVAANRLSLVFSAGTLALVVAMVLRLALPPGLVKRRTLLLLLVLLGTLTNRTFLAWTSSGLETALFGFLLLAWVYAALFLGADARAHALLALAAGLLALARPDGLLFASATVAILAVRWLRAGSPSSLPTLAPALPLLIPVSHVLWRRATYGYWLPNTYYAKHVAAWPEAGARYLAAFVLEYAYWVWLALALGAGLRWLGRHPAAPFARLRAFRRQALVQGFVVGALLAHFAYYTFLVGGDHFEFRVYQHLVPLLLVSFPWLATRAGLGSRTTLAALAAMLALGSVIPWAHWRGAQQRVAQTGSLDVRVLVSPRLPAGLRGYAAAWDALEGWLVGHFIGLRHHAHRAFAEQQLARFPARAAGERLSGAGFPVLAHNAVGVPGWVLPHVAILDTWGLNDAVIARARPVATASEQRHMAHDRKPPPGYVECFRPNLFVTREGTLTVARRPRDLTAEEIRRCERLFR